ncbi:MAG: glycosyltransferase family 4 protein [Candidatus Devosia phytovorans]|uniref:Glycosyltransferase family 4 protein n=1 Tax=Candidatus Devosia phytovorans TaxID=3121372 RepID=A0AAJ5VS41_9HYPH|nr:glycosyltransferase family 4 protein [Devosia sp.]WEK03793.1 MAG: glycosyltransferase family 4 protein [Devosia sp.]
MVDKNETIGTASWMNGHAVTARIERGQASKLTIALIGNQAFGLMNFRGALIRRLVGQGHTVVALVPDYTPATRATIRDMGAIPLDHGISRTGLNPWIDGRAIWKLRATLKQIAPDLVLAYTVKPVVYGIFAARLAGVKRRYALIEGLGHAFIHAGTIKQRLLQGFVSALYGFALHLTDRTLFLNADDRAEFSRRGLVPEERSQVVGTIGVALDEWSVAPPVVEPITFLFIGRLLYEKGVAEFAAAAEMIRADFPSARFAMVGDLDSNPSSLQRETLEDWVSRGLVEWPGHTDVRPWIAHASVFVLPSYREGFPRATQEAMAMGRPVITTDVAGCRETVLDRVNGFLIPPRDVHALAKAMRHFLDEPALIASMGAKSRDLAEKHFDVDMATNRLLDAIDVPR